MRRSNMEIVKHKQHIYILHQQRYHSILIKLVISKRRRERKNDRRICVSNNKILNKLKYKYK